MLKGPIKAIKGSKSEKKAIIVTGTPGTGKSKIARELSLYLKKKLISTTILAKNEGLFEKHDLKRDTYIVDPRRLNRALKREIEDNSDNILIIEGHMSHFLPSELTSFCIVCKTDLKELKKRLIKREYSSIKIRENLDSEIFDICLTEAMENGHKILILDTSGKFSETKEKMKKLLKKEGF